MRARRMVVGDPRDRARGRCWLDCGDFDGFGRPRIDGCPHMKRETHNTSHFLFAPSPSLAWEHSNITFCSCEINFREPLNFRFRIAPCPVSRQARSSLQNVSAAQRVVAAASYLSIRLSRCVGGALSWANQAPPLRGGQGERFEQLFERTCGPINYRSSVGSAWCFGLMKSPMSCSRKGSAVRSARRSSGSRAIAIRRLAPFSSSSMKSAVVAIFKRSAA